MGETPWERWYKIKGGWSSKVTIMSLAIEGRQHNARPTSWAEHRNGFLGISSGRPKREPESWASSLAFCMTLVMQKEGRQQVCQVLFLRLEKALKVGQEVIWNGLGQAEQNFGIFCVLALWSFFAFLFYFIFFLKSICVSVLSCFRAGSSLCVLLFYCFIDFFRAAFFE